MLYYFSLRSRHVVELTRREFLKLCLTTAITAGIATLVRDKIFPIVKALERQEGSVDPLHLVWIECGDCAGDTIALLDATVLSTSALSRELESLGIGKEVTLSGFVSRPEITIRSPTWWRLPLNSDLVYVLLGVKVKVDYHQTIMPEWGAVIETMEKVITPAWPAWAVKYLEEINDEILRGEVRPYVMVIEGSVIDEVFYARKYHGWNSILGEKKTSHGYVPMTTTEWIYRLSRGALAVVSAGTCACYGGMPSDYAPDIGSFSMEGAASHSPSGSVGFFPDPLKGLPGFIKKYREYAHSGVLAEVWDWSPEERKVYESALDPYYAFAIEKVAPSLEWNARSKLCVAVPGCPANGNATALVLGAGVILYLLKVMPSLRDLVKLKIVLDEYWRPKYIRVKLGGEDIIDFPLFGYRMHTTCHVHGMFRTGEEEIIKLETGCPRYGMYQAGLTKTYPADGSGYCLYSVGCKGPLCTCPWNAIGWIIDYSPDGKRLEVGEKAPGACTKTGAPCIACVMPGFSDKYQPFFSPAPAPVMPGVLETVATLAVPAAIGAAAAIGVRQYVKSRAERAQAERKSSGSAKEEEEKRGE